jgi:predicted ABC-type ATPase
MQEIIIVAGPNGAGKTSFANEYLFAFRGRFVFINADEIAREIADPNVPQAQLDLRAGREMLTRIGDCVDARTNSCSKQRWQR